MLFMKPNQQPEIIRRMRCAAGHLNAVIKMTEEGKPCEQVLHQLDAVQAALQAVGIRTDQMPGSRQPDDHFGQFICQRTTLRITAHPIPVHSFHTIRE